MNLEFSLLPISAIGEIEYMAIEWKMKIKNLIN